MEVYHGPRAGPLFGYLPQRWVSVAALQERADDGMVLMVHGPPRAGKTEYLRNLHGLMPKGTRMVYVRCHDEMNDDSFLDTCARLSGIIQLAAGHDRLFIALDEIEIVGIRREYGSASTVGHTLRIMSLIDKAKEAKRIHIALCTNVPCVIDEAIAQRCTESIYFPYPTADVIREALVHSGYPEGLAAEAADGWIARLQVDGWWTGSGIVRVILRHAPSLLSLAPIDLVDALDRSVEGAVRIRDPLRYEKDNAEWVQAARRTLRKYGL